MSTSGIPVIVAEAGVNHDGSLEKAFRLVDAAKAAGADFVKFQTFKSEALVRSDAPLAAYQARTESTSQVEMLRRLELSSQDFRSLLAYCGNAEIAFLSAAFDSYSLKFLIHELGQTEIKFGSGEITNGPLLLEAAQSGCSLILSTGASNLEEVREALDVLAWGFMNRASRPKSRLEFKGFFSTPEGFEAISKSVTILHCVSQYPAPIEDTNLRAINLMQDEFKIPVGFSDHSLGIGACIGAVALGAVLIEKHFTLDKRASGPDHAASLDPEELKVLVRECRRVAIAMGERKKAPTSSDMANQNIIRKSLVANVGIRTGDVFAPGNVTAKRPADGLSPMVFWEKLGQPAARDYSSDEAL